VASYLAVRRIPRLPFGTRRTSFVLAVAKIRIFSSIDQSRLGRFAGMTGRALASCNHRESVCWRRPVSNASWCALTASLPVKRVTIFCLKARENGFVTESLPSRPADSTVQASDNYPDAGGRNKLPPIRPERT
jgi:hypothetical protein